MYVLALEELPVEDINMRSCVVARTVVLQINILRLIHLLKYKNEAVPPGYI
jgi:hypothetical protein